MQKSMIDFIFNTDCGLCEKIKSSERYKKVSKEGYEVYIKLKESLNEEQKAELDKFADLTLEEQCEAEETYFKAGMKAGLRIAVECLIE
ncbi:MAG: hypothetical protein K2J83_06410 [Clostridia bacterium]|nr:hypothetical protein [Clostridia bacterium]MDE7265384.1 hypothetical protein [Clostridia bacterium]